MAGTLTPEAHWPAKPSEIGAHEWIGFLLARRTVAGLTGSPLQDAAIQAQFVGFCGHEAFAEVTTFCSKPRTAREGPTCVP
jgi:hypothetical protein